MAERRWKFAGEGVAEISLQLASGQFELSRTLNEVNPNEIQVQKVVINASIFL